MTRERYEITRLHRGSRGEREVALWLGGQVVFLESGRSSWDGKLDDHVTVAAGPSALPCRAGVSFAAAGAQWLWVRSLGSVQAPRQESWNTLPSNVAGATSAS